MYWFLWKQSEIFWKCMNFTPLDYMVPEIWCAKNGWADEQMGRQTDGENDITRWVPHLKNKQFRNIQEITEKKINIFENGKKCKSIFSRTFTFKNHIKNTKRKQFQKNSICLNQNTISRKRYEGKNLAIFWCNIYIINVLKLDKNYLANTNLKVTLFHGNVY